jgi:hypothetical protein
MKFLPNVPRCQHLKVNGTQCGSPALRRNRFCFFHKRFQEEKIKLNCDRSRRGHATFILPVLEDADSIQVSLMQIMRLLLSGRIDRAQAGPILYALQTATLNLRNVTIEPSDINDVVIDRNTIDQTCIGGNQWNDEDFDDPEEGEEEDEEEETEDDDEEEIEDDVKETKAPEVKNQSPAAAKPQAALESGANRALLKPVPAATTPVAPAAALTIHDPYNDYDSIVLSPEVANRTIPEKFLNPPPPGPPREKSLNEARRPLRTYNVSTKKPTRSANPAEMRRQVRDIVLDCLAGTLPVKS